MLVDTHCHLNFERFDSDREEVLDRARQAGVGRILNPAVDIPTSREVIRFATAYPDVFAAVGVHPNDAAVWTDDTINVLRRLAEAPGVVAIGEIGLDYYWDRTPHELQQNVFRRQLELAAEMDLPVIIHTRNKDETDRQAIADVLDILGTWQLELVRSGSLLADRPGVLHSFSGNLEEAQRAREYNFYLGITGPVTFRKADLLREVVRETPLESLLIETDAPFLTPHPYRGKRNEPAYVQYVAGEISALHNQPLEKVADLTTINAGRLFHWQATT